MDIRSWLDKIVLPEPPLSPVPLREPHPLSLLQHKNPDKHVESRRRRRPSTSDSSLLTARTARRRTLPEADIDGSGDSSACSDASHPAHHAPESSTSSQHYARRPRRKTRPERYEPTPKDAKERGTLVYRHQKGESRKSKRKSRRKRTDRSGVGLVQSFHAKNVPKDRLTLRPREKLGLFNKGRASTPVKGRGLPDLVFSEMKFLQKQKDQPEAGVQARPSKRRKRDPAHAKQEEISAYFTSVRPPLAERNVNIQASEVRRRRRRLLDAEREQEQSSVIEDAIPTAELPGEATALGAGSRGQRHDSRASYISWSDSIRAHSATPIGAGAGSLVKAGQLDSVQGKQNRKNTDCGDLLHSHATTPPATRHFTVDSGDLFHVSSSTPVNQPVQSSPSAPRPSPPSRQPVHDESTQQRRMTGRNTSPSSMPIAAIDRPDATHRDRACQASFTRFRSRSQPAIQPGHARPRTDGILEQRNVVCDIVPRSSSSLGRLLQECNSAFEKQRCEDAPLRHHDRALCGPPPMANNMRGIANTGYSSINSILPSVRFAGIDACRPLVPTSSMAGVYEQQARQKHPLQPTLIDSETILLDDDAMMEGGSAVEENGIDYYNDMDWESAREEIPGFDYGYEPVREETTPHHVEDSGASDYQSRQVVSRGFWRPHKLY